MQSVYFRVRKKIRSGGQGRAVYAEEGEEVEGTQLKLPRKHSKVKAPKIPFMVYIGWDSIVLAVLTVLKKWAELKSKRWVGTRSDYCKRHSV